jgi:hypothetical protein
MSSRTTDATSHARNDTQWGAVALGWAVAVLAGIVIRTVARQIYVLIAGPPVEGGELTATVVVISVVSGFLSYLVGGYIAARMARHSGGKHGMLTAVFGLISGAILEIVLVLFGVVAPSRMIGLGNGYSNSRLLSLRQRKHRQERLRSQWQTEVPLP